VSNIIINKENVQYSIELLQEARKNKLRLDMDCCFQHYEKDGAKTTLEEVFSCGTPCCLAGFIAVSPKWIEDGGSVHVGSGISINRGFPLMGNSGGTAAVSDWLGISTNEGKCLLCSSSPYSKLLYRVKPSEVKYEMVIEALVRLRDTGSIFKEEKGE